MLRPMTHYLSTRSGDEPRAPARALSDPVLTHHLTWESHQYSGHTDSLPHDDGYNVNATWWPHASQVDALHNPYAYAPRSSYMAIDIATAASSIPGTVPSSMPVEFSHMPQTMYANVEPEEMWTDMASYLPHIPVSQPEYPAQLHSEVTNGQQPTRAPGSRMRLSLEARVILDSWFDAHRDDPYVEKCEAEQLAAATNLTVRQVRTYFANSRARKLPQTRVGSASPELSKSSNPPPYPEEPSSKKRRRLTLQTPALPGIQQRSPMERFLSSSPEEEGIDEELVRTAAQETQPMVALNESVPAGTISSTLSRSMTATSTFDAAVYSTSGSSSSCPSIDTATRRGPRRGRRRQPLAALPHLHTVIRAVQDPKKMYQCTFCCRDFSHKYDWRRHEESVHFPQEQWMCMPDNTPVVQSPGGRNHCAFCDMLDPPPTHFESHNCSGCLESPKHQRVFTRKDKLLQHIGQVHKPCNPSKHIADWRRPIQRKVFFRCGICGIDFVSWFDRIDHISTHFAAGQDMRFWLGEPGQIQPAPSSSSFDEDTTSPVLEAMPHACNGCGAQFQTWADMVFHERQRHNIYLEYRSNPAPAPVHQHQHQHLHQPAVSAPSSLTQVQSADFAFCSAAPTPGLMTTSAMGGLVTGGMQDMWATSTSGGDAAVAGIPTTTAGGYSW